MIPTVFKKKNLKILCLGAHPDDIEIGCGGTILKITEEYQTDISWIVLSGNEKRKIEAITSAEKFLSKTKSRTIDVKSFQESYFPYNSSEVKCYVNSLKRISPDIIFTHTRHDLHQDHRLICELTWNTFRDHLILEYEIPKYDGDLKTPNYYTHLSRNICENKINYIVSSHISQKEKQWFDEETFWGIMRIRGLESASPTKYAEAFHCRKIVM
ncbi:MAG: PIG-L deacetylase family protein [Promethearchaeota archaeon]